MYLHLMLMVLNMYGPQAMRSSSPRTAAVFNAVERATDVGAGRALITGSLTQMMAVLCWQRRAHPECGAPSGSTRRPSDSCLLLFEELVHLVEDVVSRASRLSF
jgi:hypothetical protein